LIGVKSKAAVSKAKEMEAKKKADQEEAMKLAAATATSSTAAQMDVSAPDDEYVHEDNIDEADD